MDRKGFSIVELTVAFMILIIAALAAWLWFNRSARQGNANQITPVPISPRTDISPISPSPTPDTTAESSPTVIPTATLTPTPIAVPEVIYSYQSNLHSYNIASDTTTQLTSYSNENLVDIADIQKISNSTIGFRRCDTTTGDFACKLHTFDLGTSTNTERKSFGPQDLVTNSGWFDENTFAYVVENFEADTYKVAVDDAGTTSILGEWVSQPAGRGGYHEDSFKVEFSPDGQKLLYIATSSPRDIMDLNFYVYDLGGAETQQVTDATQPEWISNQEIVYRHIGDTGGGLFIYDLDTREQTQIVGIDTSSYNPDFNRLANGFLYENLDEQTIWFYSLATNTTEQILENAASAYWLNPGYLAFTQTSPCDDDCGPALYNSESVQVFNLNTREVVATLPEVYINLAELNQ